MGASEDQWRRNREPGWMKSGLGIVAAILTCIAGGQACVGQQLSPLSSVVAISSAEAANHIPVSFEATVTYSRPFENTLFVQDGDAAIFVYGSGKAKLVPGDRVLVTGTMRPSFKPYVVPTEVKQIGHGALPKPIHPSYEQMCRGEVDSKLVTVHAVIRSADILSNSNPTQKDAAIGMLVDGFPVNATVDNVDEDTLKELPNAEVEIMGVVGGLFDNKMQQVGILLHVQSLADIKIMKRPTGDPWSLPIARMDRLLPGYYVKDLSKLMHVRGTITYFHPGASTYYQPESALVLQDGSQSVWISVAGDQPLRIGDLADAIGFPEVHNGFLTLTDGEVKDSQVKAPIVPKLFRWRDLALGGNESQGHNFDLVSIEGNVVTEVREGTRVEYVLATDGRLFSAFLPDAGALNDHPLSLPKSIPVGARIRVTGICMLSDANPFNGEVPFSIMMRTYDDISVVAKPPWLNVPHLLLLLAMLLAGFFALGARSWFIERRMRRHVSHLAYGEQRRSRILEDMNALRPLPDILEQITELVSFSLKGAACWCETADGVTIGNRNAQTGSASLSVIECAITAPTGEALGKLFVSVCKGPELRSTQKVLSMGCGLAALAIETSRLHSDLVHRSEFDQLTNTRNRFWLEKHFPKLIQASGQAGSAFGLLYIDLNGFKQVNDIYGHHVGDLYLQDVAGRMKRQLRPGDFVARLGGDEFAVLAPHVVGRSDLEEIAKRLRTCFEHPFTGDGYSIDGSASIGIAVYPDDGTTTEALLTAADAAMYTDKQARRRRSVRPQEELAPETSQPSKSVSEPVE
jgi:diguanylate cyclase (GGDEF)-like protein